MLGHKIVPTANPPVYVERPWNSYTFQRTDTTTGDLEAVEINVGDIVTNLRGRLNINPVGQGDVGNEISLKIQEARVWCTAPGLVLPDLETTFYEISYNGSQSARHTQRDQGTLNMPAKVGYAWPIADSKEVLGSGDLTKLVCVSRATDTGSAVTHRVHILWRSSS